MALRHNKKFCDLSSRQQRNRVNILRQTRRDTDSDDFPIDNLSSSDENSGDIHEDNIPLLNNILHAGSDIDEFENLENDFPVDVNNVENNEIQENDGEIGFNNGGNNNYNDNIVVDIEERARELLKKTFLSVKMTHVQINAVLQVLREEIPFRHHFLPKDARTLLGTPTIAVKNIIQHIGGGSFLNIGLKSVIIRKLSYFAPNLLPNNIVIDISTDGGSVHRVGVKQFWPLQFCILNISDERPLIAAVFVGQAKPSNANEFLQSFVNEVSEVNEEGGIEIKNKRLPLVITKFIADAPARAFILNHYGHTSSKACSKCWVTGHRCTNPLFRGTTVFPGVKHRLRSDQEYFDMIDEDHHKGGSPLAGIVKLVSHVPFDSMHLVHIGVVDRVLLAHQAGKCGCQKLNWRKIEILDRRMTLLKDFCPSEFNRRPNKISMFKHFKATENRQLLMYTFPAVFENILPHEFYENFLIFHCVIRILNGENVDPDILPFCQGALELFVTRCEQLYGEQFIAYNLHCLLHIVEDVARHGSLDSYSAFSFENAMPQFNKDQRKPAQNLEQFYKRLQERNSVVFPPVDNTIYIIPSQIHRDGPLPPPVPVMFCQQYRKIKVGFFTFSRAQRDRCFISKKYDIYLIRNIVAVREKIFFIVNKFLEAGSFYNVGKTSDFTGVYLVKNLSDNLDVVSLREVRAKCYCMPRWSSVEGEEVNTVHDEFICVSLLTPLKFPPGFD